MRCTANTAVGECSYKRQVVASLAQTHIRGKVASIGRAHSNLGVGDYDCKQAAASRASRRQRAKSRVALLAGWVPKTKRETKGLEFDQRVIPSILCAYRHHIHTHDTIRTNDISPLKPLSSMVPTVSLLTKVMSSTYCFSPFLTPTKERMGAGHASGLVRHATPPPPPPTVDVRARSAKISQLQVPHLVQNSNSILSNPPSFRHLPLVSHATYRIGHIPRIPTHPPPKL